MLKILIETSIFILWAKGILRRYYHIEEWFNNSYKSSQVYALIKALCIGIKTSFKYSFLGRIMEIRWEGYSLILDNSNFIRKLFYIYKAGRVRIINYFKASMIMGAMGSGKGINPFLVSLKIGSSVMIAATLVNIIFSILLNEQTAFLNWVIRAAFLLTALCGLQCNADWETLKGNSFVFRFKIFQQNQIANK